MNDRNDKEALLAELNALRQQVESLKERLPGVPPRPPADLTAASLAFLIQQAPAVMWAIDTDLRITAAVGGAVSSSPEWNPVGTTIFDLARGDRDEALIISAHQRVLQGQTLEYITWWQDRRYQSCLQPLRDGAGTIIGAVGVAVDVTERERNERALREREALNRSIVEAMPCGIVRVALDGTILHANAEAWRILGVSHEAQPHQRVRDWLGTTIYEDGRPCPVEEFPVSRCLATGERQPPVVLGVRRPDGEVNWAVYTAVPVVDVDTQALEGAVVTFVDITQRKQAEAALQQSQERFRLLAENVPGVIYLCRNDERYTVLYLNDAVEALTGYPKAEFLEGRVGMSDLIHPDDLSHVRETISRALKAGTPYRLTYRIRRRDGEWRWVEEAGVGVHHPGHAGLLLEGYVSDVTERKVAEQALRDAHTELELRVAERTRALRAANERLEAQIAERKRTEQALITSERRLQSIMDGANAIIFVKDRNGRYLLANHRYTNSSLAASQDPMGKTDFDLFPVEYADQFRRNDQWVIEHGTAITTEEIAPHPDGPHVYVVAKFPLLDHEGMPYAVCGIATDVTEQRRTEERLRLLQSAIEQVSDAVTITTAELDAPGPQIVYVNSAFERMTGYRADEVIGKSPRLLQGPGTDRRVLQRLRADLQSGRPTRGQTVNYRKDGSAFTVEWYISPIRDKTGRITNWVAIQRDVTEAKRAEAREREHQAQLAHVARLSTMGEMATGLAHELNQPLTAISIWSQGFLRQLQEGKADIGELREALAKIAIQSDRAGQIIRRMRSFVRSPELQRTAAQINELVQEVIVLCENDLQQNSVQCRLELSEGLPSIIVDPIQIEQVILNLVRNSIDAMAALPTRERVMWITTWADEQQRVYVRVRDEGVGLSPQVRARLFEPFHTTKPHGMGMGLAISRSIIESHGGKLVGRPNTPRGAQFEFYLPAPLVRLDAFSA